MSNDLTRPIVGIENRTAQEVFDIMCDRIRRARPSPTGEKVEAEGWLYHNEDIGTELSENHPVESGEVPDATDIRIANAANLKTELLAAWESLADNEATHHAAIAALVAERDEAREVIAKGIAAQDHLVEMAADWKARATAAESAIATANARVERYRTALHKIDMLDEAMDHELRESHAFEAVAIARAALTGGENA